MATPVEIALRATGAASTSRAISGLDDKTSKLGRTLRTVAKAGALALGAGAVYGAKKLVDFTQAAIEDDAAQKRLATTLKNTTGATNRQVSGVEKWIAKQGQLLGVTDDELRPALQRMAEGTGSVTKAQRMVALAMDASAGTGKSLKSVTEALLRAQNGSVGGLSRYGIATKDAKGDTLSLSKVLDGMAEKFGGQAAVQADTLEGKMQRLRVAMSETGEAIGGKVLPYATDLADWVLNTGIPAASKWWKSTADTREELLDTAGAIKDDLIPPLKTLGGVVGDVVGFSADLPAPVRSFGGEALAAALILPRLNSAVGSVRGSLGGMVGNLRSAETRTAALQSAARLAAGAGGLALLADASNDADGAMKDLKHTAGVMAVAFAVGGPWAAAIAGFADIVGKAQGAGENFGLSQDEMRAQIDKVTESLNRQTGAFTRRTRQQVVTDLGDQGMLGTAHDLGIELPSMTRAIMQGAEGIERFRNRAMASVPQTAEARTKVVELTETMFDMSGALRSGQRGFMLEREAMGKSGKKLQEHRELVNKLSQSYNLVPHEVTTLLKTAGAKTSRHEIQSLAREYHKTPREIRTILAIAGVEGAVRDTHRANDALRNTGRVKPDTAPWLKGLTGALTEGKQRADRGAQDIAGELRSGTAKARPDLSGFRSGLSSDISGLRGTASTGGQSVGNALEEGIIVGFSSVRQRLAGNAYTAVSEAIASAHRAADARSPSRKMIQLGRYIGDGLVIGMQDRQRQAEDAGRRLALSAVGGASARDVFRQVTRDGGGHQVIERHTVERLPDRVTLILDGQPVTALVRREIAADQRWRGRMDDRD